MARVPWRFRIVLAAALLATASSGCSFSKVDPKAAVHISGRALDSAGRPLANAPVLLFREADLGQVLFGAVFVLGTLSAVCFVPQAPAVCHRARRTTTDSEGRYAFTVTGADTQGSLGLEETLDVVVGAGGNSTTLRFVAKRNQVRVPAARLVELRPRVSQGPRAIRVSVRALPAWAGTRPAYSAGFADHGTTLWRQELHGPAGVVDPRMLEDRPATATIGVTALVTGGSGAGQVRASYLSRPLAVRPTAGAPPSRGRPCAAVTGGRPRPVRPASHCALTDGDLAASARLTSRSGVVTGGVIDLGRIRPVGLVVVRGYAGQIVVEVSVDGVHYRRAGSAAATEQTLVFRTSGQARFVRVRAPSGLDESTATEVAVW